MSMPEFVPHWLLRGGHRQTIFGQYLNPVTTLRQTKIHLVDLNDGDKLAIHDDCPENWSDGDPIVILVHGLGGDHLSCYAVRLASHLNQRNVRAIRVDLRLSGASIPHSKKPCNAGQSDDINEVLKFLKQSSPNSPIALVGYSMGGNIVLKCAAEQADNSMVESVVAVCPPIDLKTTVDSLNWRTAHYEWFFLYFLISRIKKYGAQLDGITDLQKRCWPKTIRQFDEQITAPLSGYDGADDYYQRCSSKWRLEEIQAPTMIFAADDDPLVPISIFHDVKRPDHVKFVEVKGGGHIGFIGRGSGSDPDNRWIDWRILDYLENFHKSKI